MTRAIGYIRVSTEDQAEKGYSLEAQDKKLRAYAELYDIELVKVFIDGQSAKTLDREPLRNALDMLSAGQADGLLVVKLDRLTRSVKDLNILLDEYFSAGKYELMSVNEMLDSRSASGRLVINILASVAQWERETISERTSAAMQHMRKEGIYTGGNARYGYMIAKGGKLIENDEEQRIIRTAKQFRTTGMGLNKIASELNRRGLRSRAGSEFQAVQVRNMLRK